MFPDAYRQHHLGSPEASRQKFFDESATSSVQRLTSILGTFLRLPSELLEVIELMAIYVLWRPKIDGSTYRDHISTLTNYVVSKVRSLLETTSAPSQPCRQQEVSVRSCIFVTMFAFV
jgi:hypothetical protein